MVDHRLPKRVMSEELENGGRRGSGGGGGGKGRTDCVAQNRVFGITGN